MRKKNKKNERNLTLVGHLSELRKRLIYSSVVLIAAVFIFYNFAEVVVKHIIDIAPEINFVFIAPAELLLSYVKIAVIGGLVIAAPFLMLQLWLFVSPGLTKSEKKTIAVSLFVGGMFFILGVVFAYLVVLPIMLQFFMGFEIEQIDEMISFSNYLSFVINTLLSFGLIFELPILMVILTKFHILKVSFIKKNRKYTILIIFVVAALLTPPDIITQSLLALPMILLFEVGVIFASVVERKNKKDEIE
ncbi:MULTISPECIES: twin-arginine translocase subunit TatC [unclassified Sedimentibacter]|uniref:twin-arginine translocase subunit TatC n=1 Tax=unclassified Sedimentibacter TaxID=2649220 RepID=UPI0027E1FE3F|nr:twin-arginine translocase subunit TatC [Sedimentibacter sp. MB35-C1]WMJ77385.1 twin-arginine translocase subunit TatC [Sedimentibacter sp. MB35-C1]